MTYTHFLKVTLSKTWEAPKYKKEDRLPFIPTEQEIDQLIAATGYTMATLLQMLKETGIRIGEAILLTWLDANLTKQTINITPEKGSNPRILPMSNKLINMLNGLPKRTDNHIFAQDQDSIRTNFDNQRNTITLKLNNPRIKAITFHTLRHFKGTMEYHLTKDVKHVQYVLGHRNSNTTDLYINLEQALFTTTTDEWTSKVSHNLEEEQQLIDSGFQLVRSINETTAIYKKRK
jgi:integrase